MVTRREKGTYSDASVRAGLPTVVGVLITGTHGWSGPMFTNWASTVAAS